MLQGEDIVYVAHGPWGHLWYRRQALTSELAKNNRVLYIEPAIPLWRKLDGRWNLGPKLRRLLGGPREMRGNLFVYSPFILVPFSRFKVIARVNAWLLTWFTRRTLRRLRFGATILIVGFNREAELFIGQCHEKIACYDCADDYAAYIADSERSYRKLREMERRICQKVDIVFVVSEALLDDRQPWNPNIHVMHNAVDVDAFIAKEGSEGTIPSNIACIPRPIIGFMGSIQRASVDFELLEYMASCRPEWSLVLLGPVFRQGMGSVVEFLPPLERMNNVRFLGPRTYEELPRYLCNFDVCIVPFLRNQGILSSDSLKFYQYLACGKPVVSSIAVNRELQEVAKVAHTKEEFVSLVSTCLMEKDDPALIGKRIEVAGANSWEKRAMELGQHINDYLSKTKAGHRV